MSWKNTADMPIVPIARAIAAAIGMPSMPQRVDSDASATTMTVAVLALLELADDHRAEVGERRLRPVDRSTSGRPACQSRRPTKSKPVPVKQAAVLADRELAHPPQDQQLDLGELRQVDERLDVLLSRPHRNLDWSRCHESSRHVVQHCLSCFATSRLHPDHGIATRSTTSSMTLSVVSPWLAACGPSQMRWLRM